MLSQKQLTVANEINALYGKTNETIYRFTMQLLQSIDEADLDRFYLDVISDSDGMYPKMHLTFSIVKHYALPYLSKRYSIEIEAMLEHVQELRVEWISSLGKIQRDDEEYRIAYKGEVLCDKEDFVRSLHEGNERFFKQLKERAVNVELAKIDPNSLISYVQ